MKSPLLIAIVASVVVEIVGTLLFMQTEQPIYLIVAVGIGSFLIVGAIIVQRMMR